MLAELSYPIGTQLYTVISDLGLVLSGTTDKNTLSVSLDKPNSSINTSKTTSNWSAVSTVPTSIPSANHKGGIIIKQPCSTSPSHYVFMRMTALYNGIFSGIHVAYGKSVGANSSLVPEAAYGTNNYNTPFIIPTTGTTPVISAPIKMIVHGSNTATIVAIDINNSNNTRNLFAIMHTDLSTWYLKDTTSNVLPIVICSFDTTQGDYFWLMPPITMGIITYGATATYGDSTFEGMSKGSWCKPMICSPTIAYGVFSTLINSASYKFSNHKASGITYDVHNFGLNAVLMSVVDSSANVTYNPEIFPYSSITDISKVYLTNVYAFGKSGRYYSTAIGTMCKFEQFMVEVG